MIKGQGGWGRNWDSLLKDYSSGEEDDANDVLNIQSLKKNTHRVVELMQHVVPHLRPDNFDASPGKGMNNMDVMRRDLLNAVAESSRLLPECQSEPVVFSQASSGESSSPLNVPVGRSSFVQQEQRPDSLEVHPPKDHSEEGRSTKVSRKSRSFAEGVKTRSQKRTSEEGVLV